ncbi:MAG: hypothetical protein GX446_17095 [Chthonomonadales bacterium]|nr:hypothetical protein [Chthonomonadales bacterium]
MDRVREIKLQFTRRIPLMDKVCPVCGATFAGPSQRKYCSDRCVNRRDWAEHGADRNARRRAKREQAR